MQTEIFKINEENSKKILDKAVDIFKKGGLVVFPTETVYGLGASVFNEDALSKIFLAKGRPNDNPIIVHISNCDQLKKLTDSVSLNQQKLIDSFWPGPLTILFEKKKEISNIVSGGLSTIAIRMPSNHIARELIDLVDIPIAAPSANISGRPSGTTGRDIYEELYGKVDFIIDAGVSKIGLESTVVKVKDDSVLILRPGAITKEMIENILDIPVFFTKEEKDLQSSPGTKYKHYAPNAKLEIISKGGMESKIKDLYKEDKKIGIITTKQNENFFKKYEPNVFVLGDENDLEEISQNLYKALRFFDNKEVDIILCQSFKEEGVGVAIMDRLKRASSSNF